MDDHDFRALFVDMAVKRTSLDQLAGKRLVFEEAWDLKRLGHLDARDPEVVSARAVLTDGTLEAFDCLVAGKWRGTLAELLDAVDAL